MLLLENSGEGDTWYAQIQTPRLKYAQPDILFHEVGTTLDWFMAKARLAPWFGWFLNGPCHLRKGLKTAMVMLSAGPGAYGGNPLQANLPTSGH